MPRLFRFFTYSFLFLTILFSLTYWLSANPHRRFLENGEPGRGGWSTSFYPISPTRSKIDLSGEWTYSVDGMKWEPVKVPSAYDFTETVTFVRSFDVTSEMLDKSVFHLVAYGINYECQIFINEIFVGEHIGGYSSFSFQIAENVLQIGKNNVIKVVVRNELNAKNTLPLRQQVWGWRNYGGILRDIYILCTPRIWIDDVQVRTSISRDFRSATVSVIGSIDNALAEREQRDTEAVAHLLGSRYRFGFELYDRRSSALVAKSAMQDFAVSKWEITSVKSELKVVNPKLWSPENPELYTLRAYLTRDETVYDQMDFEVGIREIRLVGSDIYLNGSKLFLKGILWKEDHPSYGSAMTYEKLEEDFIAMKNLGANLVRIGDHPPHPYVLALCDRYGLLVMEEIPVTKVPAAILGRDDFQELAKSYAKEMVLRDRNHACVLAWGLGDDFDSSEPEAKEYIQSVRTLIETLDDRPVFYATSMINNDIAASEVEITAVNILTTDVKEFKRKLEKWKLKYPSQPTILARYGKAVEPGNRNGYSDPMSVESQARYFIQHFAAAKEMKIAGAVIAAFADWRGDRPIMSVDLSDRFLAPMGLTSYAREKRLAYEAVRALYHNEKIAALPMGTYSENAPITFVLVGFFLLLGFAYLLKRNPRFRDNVIRSFLRSYNFFADIRDRRIISYFQTTMLAIVVAITLALVFSNVFYYTRDNEGVDFVLTHFMVSDSVKDFFSSLIWKPFKCIVYFSVFAVLGLFLLSGLVKLFSFFVRTKVYFYHAYSTAVWSALPVVLLIPVGMVMYRVMQTGPYTVPLLLITGVVVLWVIVRLLKFVSIVYNASPIVIYAGGAIVLLVFIGIALAYYDHTQSSLAYYRYFVNFIQGTS